MPVIMTGRILGEGTQIFFRGKPRSLEDKSSTSTKPTEESLPRQGWTEEDFTKGEEALNAALAKHPPKILPE